MRKCFFSDLIEIGEVVTLDVNNSRHLITVMRLRKGDKFTLSDSGQRLHEMVIVSDKLPHIEARSLTYSKDNRETNVFITIYQGLPKGDKFDLIVRQTVELGVGRIVPVLAENCVAKLPANKRELKVERWQRLAEAAAKQSGRSYVPQVGLPLTFDQMLAELRRTRYAFVCHEHEDQQSLKSWLEQTMVQPSFLEHIEIGFYIGPEGGISQRENEQLVDFSKVSLGATILRTETAGTAVMAMLNYALS